MLKSSRRFWFLKIESFIIAIFLSIIPALSQVEELRFNHFTFNEDIPQNSIFAISTDQYGFVWLGKRDGLFRFDGYKSVDYTNKIPFSHKTLINRIDVIYNDSANNLWVTPFSDTNFYYRFDFEKDTFISIKKEKISPLLLKKIDSLKRKNNKSIASSGKKWDIIDEISFRQANLRTGKTVYYQTNTANPWSVIEDKTGTIFLVNHILWVCGYNGSLCFADINQKPFFHYFHTPHDINSIVDNEIRAIYEDDDQNLWVGTNGKGITKINLKRNQFTHFSHNSGLDNSLINNKIRKIYGDRKGFMWFGTKEGLDRYDLSTKRFKHYSVNSTHNIPDNSVYDILEDYKGNLLISTFNGIASYNREKDSFISFNPITGSTKAICRNIFEDSNKNLWITVDNLGLISLKVRVENDGKVKMETNGVYKYASNLSTEANANQIYTIAEDAAGFIWLGTTTGLKRFDPIQKKFVETPNQNDFPKGWIQGILSDGKNYIWVSHTNGLTKIGIRNFSIRNYGPSDGLQSKMFFEGAHFRNPKTGEMFFGGINGFNAFFPDSIRDNQIAPAIYITDIKIQMQSVSEHQKINGRVVLQKPIYLTKEIKLIYADRNFSLEFAGLHFTNPSANNYAYQLEGYDQDWIYTDANDRMATYSNLNPNTYTFKVKAANGDGVWSKPTILRIIISPPWWLTWWFFLIVLSITVLSVYGILYLRTALYRRKQLQLTKLVEQRTEELELSNATKDRFFSIIAHDLRNPFHVVSGLAEILKRDYKTLSPEKVNQFLTIISSSSSSGNNLLENLLHWSKSQTGKIEFNPDFIDVVPLIKQTFSFLEANAIRKNIILEMSQLDKAVIFADPDMLTTILRNLLSNAIKFTPDGGRVSVYLEFTDSQTVIQVVDNGLGITEDIQRKLFKIDTNISTRGTSNESGTGLGLILCKEFIDKHNGTLSLVSKPGNGSRFIITIPTKGKELQHSGIKNIRTGMHAEEVEIRRTRKSEERGTDSEKTKKSKESLPTIHIIEDNSDIRFQLVAELSNDYTILESENGLEGLKNAFREIPDLIISDISMPLMDGLEVCKKLKTDLRTSHIPIILLTALDSEDKKMEGFETGADDYLTKPFSSSILRVRIKNLIESRRNLRELFSRKSGFDTKIIATNPVDNAFLDRITEIINENMSDGNINVEILSERLKMSRAQLYRKIKALTNQTAYDFITTIRLKQAAELLLTSDLPIAEVAFRVGYPEPGNFARVFAKLYGQSPREFSKNKN